MNTTCSTHPHRAKRDQGDVGAASLGQVGLLGSSGALPPIRRRCRAHSPMSRTISSCGRPRPRRRHGPAPAVDAHLRSSSTSRFSAKQKAAREPGRAAFEMNCRFSRFRSSKEKTSPLRLNFELLHECGKPCGNGGCGGVVLVFQGSPNRRERDTSVATGIHPVLARIGNDLPTNPVVDPISRGSERGHEADSNVFISRSSTRVPSVLFRTERAPAQIMKSRTRRGVGQVPLASRYLARALETRQIASQD
jgi:hypothetical protein